MIERPAAAADGLGKGVIHTVEYGPNPVRARTGSATVVNGEINALMYSWGCLPMNGGYNPDGAPSGLWGNGRQPM